MAMDKPKVCFCSYGYPPLDGGVSVAAGRITRQLAGRFEMHVFRPLLAGTFSVLPGPEQQEGVTIHSVPHKHGLWQKVTALGEAIREWDDRIHFDLFHGFFLPMAYPLLPLAQDGGRPCVASIRGSDATVLLGDAEMGPMIMETLLQATWVTSVNQALADTLSQAFSLQHRASVIPNSVAVYDEAPWSLPRGRVGDVATAGFFRTCKNIPLLVEAFAQLPRKLDVRLRLIGEMIEWDEKQRVAALIDHYQLQDSVVWTGTVPHDQVFANLAEARVFVLSSSYEGSPNALLEAASMGLPIVATEVGDLGRIVQHGEEGLIVPPGDPIALAAAIDQVLMDDTLAQRLSAGARRLAARFSVQEETDQWTRLYQQLLGNL